jgi:hypothetical protein
MERREWIPLLIVFLLLALLVMWSVLDSNKGEARFEGRLGQPSRVTWSRICSGDSDDLSVRLRWVVGTEDRRAGHI